MYNSRLEHLMSLKEPAGTGDSPGHEYRQADLATGNTATFCAGLGPVDVFWSDYRGESASAKQKWAWSLSEAGASGPSSPPPADKDMSDVLSDIDAMLEGGVEDARFDKRTVDLLDRPLPGDKTLPPANLLPRLNAVAEDRGLKRKLETDVSANTANTAYVAPANASHGRPATSVHEIQDRAGAPAPKSPRTRPCRC